MRNFAEHVHFFKECAEAHCYIRDFFHGNFDKILNAELSTIKSPYLALEDPEISFFDEDNVFERHSGSFLILSHVDTDEWKHQDYVMSQTYIIARQLIKKFIRFAEDCGFDMELSSLRLSPCRGLHHDNDHGWRVDYSFAFTEQMCVEECIWDSKCPVGSTASFVVNNENTGDFSQLEIENTSLPEDHDWDYKWTWSFDNGPEQSSTDEIPEITGSGLWLYICLEITDENGCIQCASAMVCNQIGCTYSIPYKYKNSKAWAIPLKKSKDKKKAAK